MKQPINRFIQELARRASLSSQAFPLKLGDGQQAGISMKTEVPGPKSQEIKARLNALQQAETIRVVMNEKASHGNYLVDVDGNQYLDCFMQIASIPLGYNHPDLIDAMKKPENIAALVNRPAMGWFPHEDWVHKMENTYMAAAPKHLTHIQPMMCGSCSNENAMKMAFMRYMDKQRGGRHEFTEEELQSTMLEQAPGIPDLSILSFKGGFHGRTQGCLSVSNSRAIHGIDIPSMKWPKADFPRYKYPLESFVSENLAEDDRCLATVEEQIELSEKKGRPVAGIIVEPIQAEGGDHEGSNYFFQGLEKITRKHDISLIMDEVQTGGGSAGTLWCHELFGMEHGPDLVTFSKKMLSGGVFHSAEYRPRQPARLLNTWMGDPHKVILLEQVLNTMKKEHLLKRVTQSGNVLMAGLKEMEKLFPESIMASRGRGNLVAFDCPTAEIRDKVVNQMMQSGVIIGGCGESTVRLRPSLIFDQDNAQTFLEHLAFVLAKLKK